MQYRRLSRRVVIAWVALELIALFLSLAGSTRWVQNYGQDSLQVRQARFEARFEAYRRAHAPVSGAPSVPAAGTSTAR